SRELYSGRRGRWARGHRGCTTVRSVVPRRESCLIAAAVMLIACSSAPLSGAATLQSGDAIVADSRYPGPASDPLGGRGAILRVPALGGSRTLLASAGGLIEHEDVGGLRSG